MIRKIPLTRFLACSEEGYALRVIGVPKTIDNDLVTTDHCPGYGAWSSTSVRSSRKPLSIAGHGAA